MSEYDLELLAAGFSAILGVEVVITDAVQPQGAAALHGGGVGTNSLPKISIHDVFHLTYVPIPLESVNPGELFEIYVKTLTGSRIILQVTDSFTISDVKAAVEAKEDIPARKQRLVFSGKPLGDDETVHSAGIPHGGTVFLIVLLRGGAPEIQLPKEELAPSYDFDFTGEKKDRNTYMRGKYEYFRPYGWYRYALKVLGHPKYEDDRWLGPGGIRTDSSAEEWPVSYHGTSMESAKHILKEGYKAGTGQVYGKGVYSSPSLTMVAKVYAQTFDCKGSTWKIALQNRINPASEHLKIVPASETCAGADYWVSPKHDPENGVYDVRPYGVVICKDD